jgi:hypothetical protein
MSILILSNSSGQIECAISQSYDRLTKSYAGPLIASTNSASGFTIQNGNKQTGMFVGNSSIDFHRNNICFKDNSNLRFNLNPNYCLSISGTSLYVFGTDGTVSLGSGINLNYKGIQSYSTNPSLILVNSDSNCNQAIRFLNKNTEQIFNICQQGENGTSFSGKYLDFKTSLGSKFCLSGNSISLNAQINPNYCQSFGGDSLFSGNVYIHGELSGSGNFNFSGDSNSNFCVSNRSYFNSSGFFHSGVCVCKGLNVTDYISSNSGIFCTISGKSLFINNITGDNFCFKNFGTIGENGLNLTGIKTNCISSLCSCNISIVSLDGFLNANVPNVNITGDLNLSGNIKISSTNTTQNFIRANSLAICSTGNSSFNNLISGGVCAPGTSLFECACVGLGRFYCDTPSSFSCFFHPICTTRGLKTTCISGDGIVVSSTCSTLVCGENIHSRCFSGQTGFFANLSGCGVGIFDQSLRLKSLDRNGASIGNVLCWSDSSNSWVPGNVQLTNNGISLASPSPNTCLGSPICWNGTAWGVGQAYVATGQTGTFETTGYARRCFVTTGQTGDLRFIKCPSNAVTNCVLCYDGTNWVAGTVAGGGGGTTLTAGSSANSALCWNGVAWAAGQTYVATGQTGQFVGTGQTGQFVGTGQTGNFLTNFFGTGPNRVIQSLPKENLILMGVDNCILSLNSGNNLIIGGSGICIGSGAQNIVAIASTLSLDIISGKKNIILLGRQGDLFPGVAYQDDTTYVNNLCADWNICAENMIQANFHICSNTNIIAQSKVCGFDSVISPWGCFSSICTSANTFKLCNLEQGGATQGQVICWNGTNWGAGAAGGGGSVDLTAYVQKTDTGQFETSGYARRCFVTTGQTGQFLGTNQVKSIPLKNLCQDNATAGQVICWNGALNCWTPGNTAAIDLNSYVLKSETGQYESSGYARQCFLTTGQNIFISGLYITGYNITARNCISGNIISPSICSFNDIYSNRNIHIRNNAIYGVSSVSSEANSQCGFVYEGAFGVSGNSTTHAQNTLIASCEFLSLINAGQASAPYYYAYINFDISAFYKNNLSPSYGIINLDWFGKFCTATSAWVNVTCTQVRKNAYGFNLPSPTFTLKPPINAFPLINFCQFSFGATPPNPRIYTCYSVKYRAHLFDK